jgi:Na+-driven multidrug efflux pump
MALGQGTSIMVGWEAGRQGIAKAKSICQFSTNASFLIAIGTLGLLCLIRKPVMDLFTDDPAIIAMGAAVILSDFVLEAGRSRNLVLVNALRAAGDVRFPLYIGLFSMWFFSVGVSFLLGIVLNWGLVGIWIGLGLDECFRALLMQIRWSRDRWVKYIKV